MDKEIVEAKQTLSVKTAESDKARSIWYQMGELERWQYLQPYVFNTPPSCYPALDLEYIKLYDAVRLARFEGKCAHLGHMV